MQLQLRRLGGNDSCICCCSEKNPEEQSDKRHVPAGRPSALSASSVLEIKSAFSGVEGHGDGVLLLGSD